MAICPKGHRKEAMLREKRNDRHCRRVVYHLPGLGAGPAGRASSATGPAVRSDPHPIVVPRAGPTENDAGSHPTGRAVCWPVGHRGDNHGLSAGGEGGEWWRTDHCP